jgi:hypothetical protein
MWPEVLAIGAAVTGAVGSAVVTLIAAWRAAQTAETSREAIRRSATDLSSELAGEPVTVIIRGVTIDLSDKSAEERERAIRDVLAEDPP